jgi:hypothetical protein
VYNIIKDIKGRKIIPNPIYNHPEFMSDPVFIVGNGKSRKNFNLEKLKEKGTVIGCNALYRDFTPDILTVLNTGMIQEVQKEYAIENFCLTRVGNKQGIKNVTEWRVAKVNSSGCLAIKLVTLLIRPSICYMLGMDGGIHNVYKNTKNYEGTGNLPRIFKYNVQAVKDSLETKFINVNVKDDWPIDTAEFMNYKDFEETLASYPNWQRERF